MTLLDAKGEKVATRVMVAVPCGETVHSDFAMSLALMMAYTTFHRPDLELPLFFVRGTILPRARAALVNAALEKGCSHILWLDTDMRFPKDTLTRLLSHQTPVVACNYPTRQMPIEPTAKGMDFSPVFGGEGLVDVRVCGMGVMLTDVEVFTKMGKPYFALGYNKKQDDYAGEDAYFCETARKHGFRILIDSELSEAVEHCGALRYTMQHARLTLDAAKAAGAE
jgi:hypothetical protein